MEQSQWLRRRIHLPLKTERFKAITPRRKRSRMVVVVTDSLLKGTKKPI